MTRLLPMAKREALLRDYYAGVPIAQIAADYGVSQTYPSVLAKRLGLGKRPPVAGQRGRGVNKQRPKVIEPTLSAGYVEPPDHAARALFDPRRDPVAAPMSTTALLMGDPLPGRSALDQRNGRAA